MPRLDLAVTESGAGSPALLFLHYFGGSAASWQLVVDRLAPAHRCITPDLRGFGASAANDAPETWTVGDAADDVAALVAGSSLDDFVLIGHSMGGKIALALAARGLPGLKGLVLVAPSPPTPEPIADAVRARMLASYGNRAAATDGARGITFQPPGSALFEQVVADALRTAPGVWRAWLETGSRENLSDLAARVAVPVLAVSGAEDQNIPTVVIEREVVGRVPGAKGVEVAGSKHLIPFDQPGELARLIAGLAADARAAPTR